MRSLLAMGRSKAAAFAVSAIVLGAGGTALAVVAPASSSGDVYEAPASTTPAAPTATSETPPAADQAPGAPRAAELPVTPAPTVEAVTEPEPDPSAPAAAMSVPPGATPVDPADPARGGLDADGNFIPAVPVQKPGEPPVAPWTPPPPADVQPELPPIAID